MLGHFLPRLTLPEEEIDIYKDGFETHKNLLDRSEEGRRLSHLVTTIDDPVTIAVDGAWGAGKTHFLKCWVGQHLKDTRGKTETEVLYFDAFAHDYLSDPLVALSGALIERLGSSNTSMAISLGEKAVLGLKSVVPFLARTGFRVGISYLSAGFINRADEWFQGGDEEETAEAQATASAVAGRLSDDAQSAVSGFWQAEEGKRAAMEGFRATLESLTEPDKDGKSTRRLVIVVDELDRCRPDYALSLLEIIKHFFNVRGITFILGVNQRALQNQVKARYGEGTDAALYLQKFVQVTMKLGDKPRRYADTTFYCDYYDRLLEKLGYQLGFATLGKEYIKQTAHNTGDLSLRKLQHFARLSILTPWEQDRSSSFDWRNYTLVSGLLYLEAMRPDVISKILDDSVTWKDISQSLQLQSLTETSPRPTKLSEAWLLCFQEEKTREFWQEHLGTEYESVTNSFDRETPKYLYQRHVGNISLENLS
ncbi:P-loop NTPase fold protein [Lentibacter algarum]|uniref:KAP family P-loop NTPase fold protein n=1 Tax=Lentibacter algarum TaxID=576131 RepID=UPI0026EC5FB5|nr:P-loop NTPase fold protein [Lentibacter algarum]